ncbi:hypothetical protein WA026_018522 [Henosepilachna vigintioctopunctata]|uniref:Chemosensory protein n=1 Tax=Henosepilachna vigintioctopunctata TaxID=420089 RepID=A0AAW1UDS7_9CUCU
MNLELIGITLLCLASVFGEDKYTSKYNNIDLDAIIRNERLLKVYFRCLTEGVGCTPEGNHLRKVLPEAIQTGCAKCTEEHKRGARKVVKFLMEEKPQFWEKLVNFYDPDKIFRERFKQQLLTEGIKI